MATTRSADSYRAEWRKISDAIRHNARLQMADLQAVDDPEGVARTAEASEYATSALLGLATAAQRLDNTAFVGL